MAVKTLYFKEHEGMAHNPSMAWWCQSINDQTTPLTEQALDKGHTAATRFTIFPDECKALNDGQKSLQKSLPEYYAHIDLGFSQPMLCAKYPPDQLFGVFSSYGSQLPGRVMLPMPTDDGPIFVNPKQYHGIMRRRKSRAKAVLENRPTKKRKPFMHLSRHLHAMRRPRGTGGRFLNSKSSNNEMQAKRGYDMQLTGSQSSNSGTLNSSKEGNSGGSHLEVTSMYSREDFNHFSINHLGPLMMGMAGHSIVMPSKRVATPHNCCNLNV